MTVLHARGENDDKGPLTMAVCWTLTAFTTLVVMARLYIRQWVLHNPGLDDWLIVVSMILGLLFCGLSTASVSYGYGKHTTALSIPDAEKALFYNVVAFIVGIVSFALPKLAVAALLCRLLNPNILQRCMVWGLTSLVAVVALANILIYVTMCDPPQALWQISMVMEQKATCRSIWVLIDYATFNGAISAFVDLYMAVYPSFVLFRLQMSLRKKIALSITLGLGTLAAACAIAKCTQIEGLANQSDATYGTVPLVIWTNIEADVVIIASCIPILHPLLEMVTGRRTFASSRSRSQNYYQSHYADGSQVNRSRGRRLTISKNPSSSATMKSVLREGEEDDGDSQDQFLIRRTDDVQVQYEMQVQEPPKSLPRETKERTFG